MEQDNKAHEDFTEIALKVFNLSQNAAETWLGSCSSARRELLEIIFTNREADNVSLRLTWKSPFDVLAKQLELSMGWLSVLRSNRSSIFFWNLCQLICSLLENWLP
jgi:hypothetical protein